VLPLSVETVSDRCHKVVRQHAKGVMKFKSHAEFVKKFIADESDSERILKIAFLAKLWAGRWWHCGFTVSLVVLDGNLAMIAAVL